LDKINDLAQVIAPPYDVISTQEQKILYAKNEHNIAWLDVTQEGSGEPSDDRYEKASMDFTEWLSDKVLLQDEQPAVYVYEQNFTAPTGENYTRRGFYALRRLEAFGQGKVHPHERTLSGPKKDRLRLMKATSTQMSPIFGLFSEPSGQATLLLEQAVENKALFDIKDDAGQKHRLWKLTDPLWIEKLQAAVEESLFLIADGHHRYETALAYAAWRKDNKPNEIADYVLMFCEEVEDPGLLVLPTHRIVRNRKQFSAADFLAKVRDFFAVKEFSDPDPKAWMQGVHQQQGSNIHSFGIALKGDPIRYLITLTKDALKNVPALKNVAEPLKSLDAAILHKCLLEDFLGFKEEDQENTDYINYLKSEEDFLKRLSDDSTQVGILMNPAPLPQIRAIAEAGQFMPPKTTYFYPKLPTGLLINLID
jgi:uncharacterized protein (DUF1015 family)